jgi:hypothetical protein
MCSWLGESGRGRSWAKWRWTFSDGTTHLVCGRHKTQAERSGGHGQEIKDLVGFVVAPSVIDRSVADASKPLTIAEQVLLSLRSQIRAELREYLRGAVLYVDFEDDGQVRRPDGKAKPPSRRRAS